jgi:Cu-Zn family superoxide dismutase
MKTPTTLPPLTLVLAALAATCELRSLASRLHTGDRPPAPQTSTLHANAVATGASPLPPDPPPEATATLSDTSGREVGTAEFIEDRPGTVRITVQVRGLTSGPHGLHIHAVASCDATTTPAFASAGGHFNPHRAHHGLENPAGAHAGDLPNLRVTRAGTGLLSTTTDWITLRAGTTTLFDVDGSALVLHAAPDDQLTDPGGNSGARIACGVIQRR